MIWVLEWDSGIGDFSLIIQLTNSEEGKGVRIFFFFFLGSYFSILMLLLLIFFHIHFCLTQYLELKNIEYLQAGKQICFYHKYLRHLNSEGFYFLFFQ